MGPRRAIPISNSTSNASTAVTICTSVGFRSLEISTYIEAVTKLRPDVVVSAVDVGFGTAPPGIRKQEKMAERSTAWLRGLQTGLKASALEGNLPSAIWAPILLIDAPAQATYLGQLESDQSNLDGLVLYDDSSALTIPNSLQRLLCVSLAQPKTPHDVLKSVSFGIDLLALPFINEVSDVGIAFAFKFPAHNPEQKRLPLGYDLWSSSYARDLSPLQDGCTCYTCSNHHRAYIHHLLSAKEMLAWVLLQIHNHRVIDEFFGGVRESIARGVFETTVEDFSKAYESDFPEPTGEKPR